MYIFFESSFLIAIKHPLISKAVGSPEGLIKTGHILVPLIIPKSNNLLFICSEESI